jgi:hypothetical protein
MNFVCRELSWQSMKSTSHGRSLLPFLPFSSPSITFHGKRVASPLTFRIVTRPDLAKHSCLHDDAISTFARHLAAIGVTAKISTAALLNRASTAVIVSICQKYASSAVMVFSYSRKQTALAGAARSKQGVNPLKKRLIPPSRHIAAAAFPTPPYSRLSLSIASA